MDRDGCGRCPILYVVIPCYNEEEVLPETAGRLSALFDELVPAGEISPESRVLFSDDGSTDGTWDIVCGLHDAEESGGRFTGISLAHNRGHQSALLAGLMAALDRGCDVAVSMDADLQDDPQAIRAMLAEYDNGANIVFGVRDNREADTAFKRGSAWVFYRLMRVLGAEVVPDSADFRLMDAKALRALGRYRESNLFLRGIVTSMGFRTAKVYYRRAERFAGTSKYPLGRMMALAVDGITSFSVVPLRLVTATGMVFVLVSLAAVIYALASLAFGTAVSGWTSLLVSIWFVGGALMVSLGVVGEYVGKTYIESKARPRYEVMEELD